MERVIQLTKEIISRKNNLKTITFYLLGIITGIILCVLYSWTTQKINYVTLPKDYIITGDKGVIKKGTKLKVDKGFGEGFTRYILYLNVRDSEPIELDSVQGKNEIKPYWLQPTE